MRGTKKERLLYGGGGEPEQALEETYSNPWANLYSM
jgi:hypothetical protein